MNCVLFMFHLFLVCSIMQVPLFSQNDTKDYYKQYRRFLNMNKKITLLDSVKSAIQKKQIEDQFKYHNYIQTFGCAYEADEIELNSIRAVYRAVIQSIRNRKIELRDDLTTILHANPPRPDNLVRKYSIYVNIPIDSVLKPARYEIQILNLVTIATIESPVSVWTRIVTRFAYKEDYNKIKQVIDNQSEFVEVMEKSQKVFQFIEKNKFSSIRRILSLYQVADIYPASIDELIFGDSMKLFIENNTNELFWGIYLGKGIIACEIPKKEIMICKLGEEHLYGMCIDVKSFRRTTKLFAELNYQAPEFILHCLFLKFNEKKVHVLPSLNEL